jgi:hypothetical protein
MAIGSGLGSQVGFSQEVTYGTAETPTTFLEARSAGLEIQVEHMMSEALRPGLLVQRKDRQVVNRKGVNGSIELDVTSNNLARFFRHCMNDDRAFSTTKTGSGTAKTYTYRIGDPATMPSMTVQVGVADITGTVRRMDATGCYVSEFSVNNSVDEILQLSATIDGRDMVPSSSSITTASYATTSEPLTFAGGSVSVAGSVTPVKSFEMSVSHGIDLERYQINSTTLKSRPIRNAMTEITGTVEMEFGQSTVGTWATDSLVDRYRAGTTIGVDGIWTGNTAINGTDFPSLKLDMPAALITACTPTIEGPEILTLSVEFMALDDGTNPPLELQYVSSEDLT